MKWIKTLYSNRYESVPKKFFIRDTTRRGERSVKLFRYDKTSPSGYYLMGFFGTIREAKSKLEILK